MIYRKITSRNPSCSWDWVDMEPVSHLLYLPLCVPRAPPARVLKWGVSLRVPGADSPSLGEVVLRPLTAPSRLLSPRLGDLRARHASATAGWVQVRWCNSSEVTMAVLMLTCDWTVVFIKVNAHASSLPSADAATPSTTQRDGHHTVHIGQHDGHTDTWQTHRVQFYSPVFPFSSSITTSSGFLTHADSCDYRGCDDRQGHSSGDGQVPLVTRRLLQIIVSMNLWPPDKQSNKCVFGNPHLMSHEAKINETLLPFLVTSTFILKSIFIFKKCYFLKSPRCQQHDLSKVLTHTSSSFKMWSNVIYGNFKNKCKERLSVTDYHEIFHSQIQLIYLGKPCVTDCIMAGSRPAEWSRWNTSGFLFVTLHQVLTSPYHSTPPEDASAQIIRIYHHYLPFQSFF